MIDNYKDLACAIITQAIEDYKREPSMRYEIREFIKSGWFTELTDINPDILLEKLNKMIKR